MKIKKFLTNASKIFGVDFLNKEISKKDALKKFVIEVTEKQANLQKKLESKKLTLKQKLQYEEELQIYSFQIKKAKKILEKKLEKSELSFMNHLIN